MINSRSKLKTPSIVFIVVILFLAVVYYWKNKQESGVGELAEQARDEIGSVIESEDDNKSNGYINYTSPFVIKEDGVYKMWLRAERSGVIYYAISKDGINWTKYENNPVLEAKEIGEWDQGNIGAPAVLKIKGEYLMWYRGGGGVDKNFHQIGLAISKDGINWDKYENNPILKVGDKDGWDSESLVAPHIIYDKNIFKMYYRGSKLLNQDLSGIGLATSLDGINWDKYENNPILVPGSQGEWDDKQVGDPSVLFNENQGLYHMWYSGESFDIGDKKRNSIKIMSINVPGFEGYGKMIGYATSKDGVHWSKYNKNPVLELGNEQEWDFVKVDNPFVMFDEGVYKMWYRGSGEIDGIGYATSIDGIKWTKFGNNPVFKP